MQLQQLKYQILLNSKVLADLYEQKKFIKSAKKSNDNNGNLYGEYFCHNKLKELSAQIAKLVVLQKALKADAAKELSFARSVRKAELHKQSAMDRAGEIMRDDWAVLRAL